MNSSSEGLADERGPTILSTALVVHYEREKGRRFGLNGFEAEFSPGITGLVGPNGAGKTTFLRVACGLLSPGQGRLLIRGRTPTAYVQEEGIGFLPESPVLPGHLSVGEFLAGIPPFEAAHANEFSEAQEVLGAEDLMERPCNALSLGQRKRVALSAALKGSPSVLLLDEPTNGLDPLALRELREILLKERDMGKTIVVSSHHLDELQRTADALVFVREGRAAGAWTQAEAEEGFSTLEALFHHVFGGRPS